MGAAFPVGCWGTEPVSFRFRAMVTTERAVQRQQTLVAETWSTNSAGTQTSRPGLDLELLPILHIELKPVLCVGYFISFPNPLTCTAVHRDIPSTKRKHTRAKFRPNSNSNHDIVKNYRGHISWTLFDHRHHFRAGPDLSPYSSRWGNQHIHCTILHQNLR